NQAFNSFPTRRSSDLNVFTNTTRIFIIQKNTKVLVVMIVNSVNTKNVMIHRAIHLNHVIKNPEKNAKNSQRRKEDINIMIQNHRSEEHTSELQSRENL